MRAAPQDNANRAIAGLIPAPLSMNATALTSRLPLLALMVSNTTSTRVAHASMALSTISRLAAAVSL